MSNSLASVHPELISEWSEKNLPLTPDKITFGSNKRVWWKGACGHEWETSVKARSKGEKCPICSGARVIEGINDLATLKPLLAQEWSEKNELKPTEVSVASHKKIIWKCKHGHEWEASVKSRTVNGTGCPYCSHNKVLAGFNDLASQYPDIAAEWSDRNLPLLPTMVTAFANSKAWWKCKDCGNEWHTLISTRSGGSRCPYCSGYTLLKGFNDLATTHPELAAEWSERNYPLMPDEVNAKSRHNVWWKCKTCGNEWKSVINARVKGTVCPVCADRAVLAGYNDLATTDRKLLAEWDYEKNSLLPTQVSRRSMKSVWWKCSLGHSWKAKISDRTIIGEKCTVCEKEYRSVFPGLAVAYYANQKGLKVQLGSDKLLGIPLETYIPSQGDLTTCLGWQDTDNLGITLATKLTDVINETMNDPTVGILHHDEGVDLVPANLELSAMEFNLVNAMSRETALRNYLSEVKDKYDYILIDCMPSLGMVTINALSAADSVIIPVQAQYLPAKGMTQLVQTISRVKKRINPNLKIDGMLLTLVDSRTNLAKSTVEALRENFGNQIKMYRTYIPIAVKAAETSSKGKSIFAYEPNSTVSKAYTEFTKEVLADGRKKERLHSHEAR